MCGVAKMSNLIWSFTTSRFLKKAALGLLISMNIYGVALGANDTNKLINVTVDSGESGPEILLQTSDPVGYRYTVYDSFEPTRVVIDFPGMELTDVTRTLQVDQGAIKEVRLASFDLASGQLARVEILLSEPTEYQVDLEGQRFRVGFTAETLASLQTLPEKMEETPAQISSPEQSTPSSLKGSEITNLHISPGEAILEADGRIDQYKYFSLENPSRLVVDIYGLKPRFEERLFPAEGGFEKVRIGSYPDKTRLVFDAETSVLPTYDIEEGETDIIMSWGDLSPVEDKSEIKVAQNVEPAVEQEQEKPAQQNQMQAPKSAVVVEAVDFENQDGRSIIKVSLSRSSQVNGPFEEENLVRFEIPDASISRALRRKIDASAFPSAVISVVPYIISEKEDQNVRIAVKLKGQVPYALEKDGAEVRLVIDDGVYAEPEPPAVSMKELVAPTSTQQASERGFLSAKSSVSSTKASTAEQMAAEANRYTGEKITLIFDAANIRSILQLIGDVSGLNILASSDVQGTVTLRLIDVPWDQALDLVLETTNLGKIQQGNILRIMPKEKIREIEQQAMKEQMVAIEEGVLETRTYSISYASVDDMKGFLTDIKSDRGSIIADSRNKQLIIRDATAVLEQMEEMIMQIDKPERQVMIEARIVEANTNFSRNLGVKWNFDYNQDGIDGDESFSVNDAALGLGGSFILPVTNPAVAGAASAISFGAIDSQLDIDLRLAALENNGEGRIVSTPKITTLNGEQATISQGTKIPFSSVSDSGTDVQFENAELKLAVTPEINPDGSILLEIDASNSSVGSVVPTATGDAVSIDEKKAQTKVLVRNGQTTVIGGIFIEQENESQSGVPILKDVPILGHLFKSTSKTKDRRELLIFITPRIVES